MIPASWINYGAGFPGHNGVIPTMTVSENPWRGADITINISNSSDLYTVGFVLVGLTRDSIPTRLGGSILVDPLLFIALPLSPWGGTLFASLPTDYWADGLAIDLQTLELDPYAKKGVSFTDGLELTLGDG
jgi:hypothetical protein